MTTARSYVELKIAALSLRGRRIDPFAVLMRLGRGANATWEELSRTEIVWSDNDPAFVQSFEIPFFDRITAADVDYRVVLYSKTSRSDELRKNAFLGRADFTLDRILSKKDGVIERVLRNKAGKNDGRRGRLIICGEKVDVPDVKHMFSIQFGFSFNSNAWGPDAPKRAKKAFYVS